MTFHSFVREEYLGIAKSNVKILPPTHGQCVETDSDFTSLCVKYSKTVAVQCSKYLISSHENMFVFCRP
jgi:hypothetical protein